MSCVCKTVDCLQVQVYDTREEMGAAAASQAAEYLRMLGREKEEINILFAAAPSQHEFLKELAGEKDVPWHKVTAMQLDDYIGIAPDAPQRFSNFLAREFFDHIPLGSRLMIDSQAEDVPREILRYTQILQSHPVDVSFIGIGENGHIAFNDPGVADFFDPAWCKEIQLEQKSRVQQVNDGCFASLDQVPSSAITVSIPAILRAPRVFCMVPGKTKAEAVRATLRGAVLPGCPATALRVHKQAVLYIDRDSAALL